MLWALDWLALRCDPREKGEGREGEKRVGGGEEEADPLSPSPSLAVVVQIGRAHV